MKKFLLFSIAIFMFLTFQTDALSQMPSINKAKKRPGVDYLKVPRVSAYEAYVKFKTNKAIIIQAGGITYENRHILGALNYGSEKVQRGNIKFPKFPRRGIEIFTYCY